MHPKEQDKLKSQLHQEVTMPAVCASSFSLTLIRLRHKASGWPRGQK